MLVRCRPEKIREPYYAVVCFGTPALDCRKDYYRSLASARRDMASLEGGSMTNARIVRCKSRAQAIAACISDGYYVMASK